MSTGTKLSTGVISIFILMAAFLFVADQFFMMAIKMICM